MPSSKRPSASGSGFEPTEVSEPRTLAVEDEHTAATTAPTPPKKGFELAPGTMVGEYRIESKIGTGGMGVVFAAVHPMIGKRAAIKILRQELCADDYAVERFIDEARVVNQIGHPNIVDVFAFGQLEGRHYFVMEWLKGEPLRLRIARGRVSLVELCAWVRPLTRALMAAHAKGIVHRDLKPDNVFLEEVGEDLPVVKLLDFGIAKLTHAEHRMEQTASGVLVGTPQYISPEQAKGTTIDFRADVYALGVILFEMLTGRLPFLASSAMEVIAMHLMEAPPRPSSIASGVPRELDDLVLGMLAKDPAQRPPLARVCEALDRVKAGAYVVDEPSGPVMAMAVTSGAQVAAPIATVSTLPPRRRPRLWWIALPLVALLGGAIAFVAVTSSTQDTARPEPIATPPVATPPPLAAPPPMAIPPIATTPPLATPPPIATPLPPPPKRVDPPKPAPKRVPHPKPVAKPAPAGSGSDGGELLFEPGTLPPKKDRQ